MDKIKNDSSVIIIGAGFAGLAAGIYARLNGYDTKIYEMHSKPGGLCTSWKRKGYTIDGCIHWLVGSAPGNAMHDIWEEAGIIQGRTIINMEEYMRLEDLQGRKLIFYSDVDKLEKSLLEFSPQDEIPVREFTDGIRMCIPFNQPSKQLPFLKYLSGLIKMGFSFIKNMKKIRKWMKITSADFSARLKDPLLKEAIEEMWIPEFSMLFMLFTFAYLHNKNAGYPVGGSMPMAEALEKRFIGLGGRISYNRRVEKVIVENNRAVGVRFDDATEEYGSRVISAADGYTTIFKMLDGRYSDEKISEMYGKWPLFYPLIYIGIGVARTFENEPFSVAGFSFQLEEPVMIGDSVRTRLPVRLYNHDHMMAPAGKSVMTIMLQTDYDYWKEIAADREHYLMKKKEIGETVIKLLEQRFPGITDQVEMIDVATPLTFERYTGNRKGSFEGWLLTPSNSYVLLKPLSQTLPGLQGFYMCGQWVEPGGGLPTAIMSGRRLVRRLCREDGRKFSTQPAKAL